MKELHEDGAADDGAAGDGAAEDGAADDGAADDGAADDGAAVAGAADDGAAVGGAAVGAALGAVVDVAPLHAPNTMATMARAANGPRAPPTQLHVPYLLRRTFASSTICTEIEELTVRRGRKRSAPSHPR